MTGEESLPEIQNLPFELSKPVIDNSIGLKAVNALSSNFKVQSTRDGASKMALFSQGKHLDEYNEKKSSKERGTYIEFCPDSSIFGDSFSFREEYKQQQQKDLPLDLKRINYYSF
ncbi:hypothetical protein ACTFIW_000866 [Dictyostelium discoideum]